MKTYFLSFGSGDPRQFAGLAPTFLMFKLSNNTNVTPPSISEIGTSSGIFTFDWGTTTPIAFLADAATTSPGPTARYVVGSLDPSDRADEYGITLTAIGTSNIALGTTNVALGTTNVALGITNFALGTTAVAIGSTGVAIGTTAVAIGISGIALGNTILSYMAGLSSPVLIAIGSTSSSFGSTSSDPVDLFGYLKRLLENFEGNETFIKSTGALSIYTRGSSTLLAVKTIANSVSAVIKT